MTGGHPGKYLSCEPAAAITSISSENTFSDAYFWLEHPWLKSHLSSGCSFSSEGLTSPQTGNGVRQLCSGGKRKQLKQHQRWRNQSRKLSKWEIRAKMVKKPLTTTQNLYKGHQSLSILDVTSILYSTALCCTFWGVLSLSSSWGVQDGNILGWSSCMAHVNFHWLLCTEVHNLHCTLLCSMHAPLYYARQWTVMIYRTAIHVVGWFLYILYLIGCTWLSPIWMIKRW